MEVTREKIELRLTELRQAQIEAIAQSSIILGRIDECELLLMILAKEEVEEKSEEETSPPPPPKLVEDS